MDEDLDEISRRLLTFTLEIISLLSGEDYTIVRKTLGDCYRSQSPDPITVHLPIHERSKKKILELSSKMIELLTGEVTAGTLYRKHWRILGDEGRGDCWDIIQEALEDSGR
ncbi:gastrula zinc finger protein XlCGF66.1-like [Anomaloglossus baeobatrachus]